MEEENPIPPVQHEHPEPPVRLLVWTGLAFLWVAALGFEAYRAVEALRAFRRGNDRLDNIARTLNQSAAQTVSLVKDIQEQGREVDFLQGLVNVLPEERGFVRTQAAMSDEVEALRAKVGWRLRSGGLHVLVDTKANKLYLKKGLTLLWAADCSVGRGGILKDAKTGRRWEFVTPRGQFEIWDKIEKPVWTKPDWAFVESGEPVPPPGDPKRKAEGELGGYVLNLGDGYLIHGTKTEAMLGRPASHGCVRLGAVDLKKLYETVPKGTRVYIY